MDLLSVGAFVGGVSVAATASLKESLVKKTFMIAIPVSVIATASMEGGYKYLSWSAFCFGMGAVITGTVIRVGKAIANVFGKNENKKPESRPGNFIDNKNPQKQQDFYIEPAKITENRLMDDLIAAIEKPDLTAVETLIRNNVSFRPYIREKRTPIHWAMTQRNLVILKTILNHSDIKKDINTLNDHDETPLYMAVLRHNSEFVKCLLEHGARMDMDNKDPRNPLKACIPIKSITFKQDYENRIKTITVLLENIHDKTKIEDKTFCDILDLLLMCPSNAPDRSKNACKGLFSTAEIKEHLNKNPELILKFIKHPESKDISYLIKEKLVDVNQTYGEEKRTILHTYLSKLKFTQDTDLVDNLFKLGADSRLQDGKGRTPLQVFCLRDLLLNQDHSYSILDILKTFIENDIDLTLEYDNQKPSEILQEHLKCTPPRGKIGDDQQQSQYEQEDLQFFEQIKTIIIELVRYLETGNPTKQEKLKKISDSKLIIQQRIFTNHISKHTKSKK